MVAGKDNFFTIYKVNVVISVNRQSDDIGILFYNHKTKNFYLFIQTYDNDGDVIKFITWLCGFSGSLGHDHLLYPGSVGNYDPNQFKYYLTFDDSKKKLYSVSYIPASSEGIVMDGLYDSVRKGSDERITKQELKLDFDTSKVHVPPIDNAPIEVTSEGIKFTLVKAFGDETADYDYFSEKLFDFSDKAKLKTALERAYEASDFIHRINPHDDDDDDD